MERKMGLVVRLSDKLINSAGTFASAIDSKIVQWPLGKARDRIARVEGECEILRQSIGGVQRGLSMLEGIVEKLGDHEARGPLQDKINAMSELLSMRLNELSSIDQMLQDARRRICRQDGKDPARVRTIADEL